MELRTLRYFLTVAEEENITHAADILHITQPTLSRQMMDLEKELGTTLMIRGKSGLTLTGDGLFLKQRTEEIIELADRLEQAFAERNTYVSGVISIGATEAVGSRLFARLIREFSNKYPQIKFKLYNEMADYIKDSIDKGLIDVGLLLEPIDTAKYDFVRLSQKETWGVLMRDDHPLAGNTSITPEDIAEYPLILPLRERPRREIIDWMKREEKDLNSRQLYAAFQCGAACRRGHGMRILPGRSAGHPQQSASAFYSDLSGAHHTQHTDLEEKSFIFLRDLPVHSGNQHAPGKNRIILLQQDFRKINSWKSCFLYP